MITAKLVFVSLCICLHQQRVVGARVWACRTSEWNNATRTTADKLRPGIITQYAWITVIVLLMSLTTSVGCVAGHVRTDSGFHLDTIAGEVLVPTGCMFANCPWAVSLGQTRKLWCHLFATYQPTYTQITINCRTRGYVSPGRFSQWVWALSLIFIGFADLQLNVPFVVTGSDTVHSFYRLSSLFSVSRSFFPPSSYRFYWPSTFSSGTSDWRFSCRQQICHFCVPSQSSWELSVNSVVAHQFYSRVLSVNTKLFLHRSYKVLHMWE